MKKYRIKILIGLCVVLSIICVIKIRVNNSAKDEVSKDVFESNTEYININVMSDNALCFDMVFFTDEKIEEVRYLSVNGKNIERDSFEVEIVDNTVDSLKEHSYKGVYCSDWMITLKQKGQVKECSIDTLQLIINGETKQFDFEKEIKYSAEPAHVWNEEFMFNIFPTEFSSDFLNSDMVATYSFVAGENIVLNSVEILEDINVNTYAIVNGEENNIKKLPVSLVAGDKVEICVNFESESLSVFDYVHTNIVFEYVCDGEIRKNVGIVTFNPIYPITAEDFSNVDNYIEQIIFK